MKKVVFVLCLFPCISFAETDVQNALDNAIMVARTNCSGISAKMERVKKMAGIGTAVNTIGTVAGTAGTISGVVKWYKDLDVFKGTASKTFYDWFMRKLDGEPLSDQDKVFLKQSVGEKEYNDYIEFFENINNLSPEQKNAVKEEVEKAVAQNKNIKNVDNVQHASDTAGKVRTGLFAANTATNVAGAIVSSQTVANDDFIEQIKKCNEAIEKLRSARTRANFEDGNMANYQQMNLSQNILEKCGKYEFVDITPLNNLAKGAIAVNSIGAATGTAATITSVIGNNKKVSDIDLKPEDAIKKVNQYEKVNVASNVMGGVTAAASLTGTILNATQIKTAKQILSVAQECEESLQW